MCAGLDLLGERPFSCRYFTIIIKPYLYLGEFVQNICLSSLTLTLGIFDKLWEGERVFVFVSCI